MEGTLGQHVQLPRRAGKYPTGRLFLSLVDAYVSDLPRFSDTRLLQGDTVAHDLLGFAHPSTFRWLLARFTVPEAKQIGGRTWPAPESAEWLSRPRLRDFGPRPPRPAMATTPRS